MKFQTSFPERYFKVHNSEKTVGNDKHQSQPWEASMAGGGEMGPGWEEEKPEFLLYIKKKIFLEGGKVTERSWTFSQHAALNAEVRNSTLSCVTYSCLWITQMKSTNTTQMNFSVTSLEKKTKGSFHKLFKKQGGKWGRNCTSLLLIWWTLNFPKHESPRQGMEEFCTTHIWWN